MKGGKYYIKEGSDVSRQKDTGFSFDSRQAAEEAAKAMLAAKRGRDWFVTVYIRMYHRATSLLPRKRFEKNVYMGSTW